MIIPALEGIIDRLLKLLFDVARHFTHPEHHPRQNAHRHHRHDALKQLLLALRKLAGGFVDKDSQAQAQRRRKQHPNPHYANPAAALGAFQIAGNQADNQRSFQAFT